MKTPDKAFQVICSSGSNLTKYDFGPALPGGIRKVEKFQKRKLCGWNKVELEFDTVFAEVESVLDTQNILFLQNSANYTKGLNLDQRMVLTICSLENHGRHFITSCVKEIKAV